MVNQNPARILLIKDGDQFWSHRLGEDQQPVHVAFMDVSGKSLTDDYPIVPLIAGGGSESEINELLERAVKHSNEYRAAGHLEKDIKIARLERQTPVNPLINLGNIGNFPKP